MKTKYNFFLIIGLILFTQCKKEESNDPAPVVEQLVKDLSGTYIGEGYYYIYDEKDRKIGYSNWIDTFLVARFISALDDTTYLAQKPNGTWSKTLNSEGKVTWSNSWFRDGNDWSDSHSWEIRNDSLIRTWYTKEEKPDGTSKTYDCLSICVKQ